MSSSYNFDPGSAFQLRKDARYTTSSCSGDSSRSCIACVLTKLEGDSSRILGVEHEQLGFRPVTTCSHRMHKPDGEQHMAFGRGGGQSDEHTVSLAYSRDGEVDGGELVGGVTRRIAFFVWLTLCCLRLVECQIRRSICTQCSMAIEE